jgi:Fic family protein
MHQLREWPHFQWDDRKIVDLLVRVRHEQGRLIGKMETLGFGLQVEASLETLTLEVIKSGEIEGEVLDRQQVRSSIARRLGLDVGGIGPVDRHVEGFVEMMMDATQNFQQDLSEERLFAWHASLFPTGRSGMREITVGHWRKNIIQVVSGPMGKEMIHYQGPDAELVPDEMVAFIKWFNKVNDLDPVLKSAIAHLWFVTLHPFEDGNGRIARAIADLQLARSDLSPQRFYSMSAQIRKERNAYYTMLEETQKGNMDITRWMIWFLECLQRALNSTQQVLAVVLTKAKFWEKHTTTSFNERQNMMINKMLDGIEGKMTSTKWAKMAKTSPDTALRDIQDLIAKGVLVNKGGSKKGANYDFINLQ